MVLRSWMTLGPFRTFSSSLSYCPPGRVMGGGERCLFTLLGGGCNWFGLSLLLWGECGKEAFTVPSSWGMNAYDPETAWRGVAHGWERRRISMSNYITPWLAPLLPIFFPGAGRMARQGCVGDVHRLLLHSRACQSKVGRWRLAVEPEIWHRPDEQHNGLASHGDQGLCEQGGC